jgi:branched-chain amino acid transport system ATP-binding protein
MKVVEGVDSGPALEACQISAAYDSATVVRNVDLQLYPGEVVALLGANGAGKTTTLLALSGDHPVSRGQVRMQGQEVTSPLHCRARSGLALVTEERSLFTALTVRQNLRVGRCDADLAFGIFPELEALLDRRVGLLSGGEQQILALARALSRRPAILLADELSLGLAPIVVQRLLRAVRAAADEGIAALIVEQHIQQALKVADRVYVMRRGQIVLEAPAAELRENVSLIENSYLADLHAIEGDAPQ